MFRVALSTYLMLVLLAGPWFCCCLTVRQVHATTAEAPKRHTCCGDAPSSGHEHSSPKHQPSRPANAPECPCRGSSQDASHFFALKSEAKDRFLVSESAESAAEVLPPNSVRPLVSTPPGHRDRSSLPFWSCLDLLFGMHILRC